MPAEKGIKILSENRKAWHNYFLEERFEAGMVLTGTEVKACRGGMMQLKDGYVEVVKGEAWLASAHISEYSHGNIMNHLPERRRKLLLHKREIEKLHSKTRERGFSLIPTKVYLKNGKVKIEFALGNGKKLHDKRDSERKREQESEARAAVRRHTKQ